MSKRGTGDSKSGLGTGLGEQLEHPGSGLYCYIGRRLRATVRDGAVVGSPHAAAEPPSALSAPRSRRSSSPSCSALSPLLPGCLAASQGPTLRRRKAASPVRSGLSSGWAVILHGRQRQGYTVQAGRWVAGMRAAAAWAAQQEKREACMQEGGGGTAAIARSRVQRWSRRQPMPSPPEEG